MISEGALSAKVVLVGAQGTNCDPEGPSRFLIFSLCYNGKKIFAPYGPPWAPPWLWAPGKSSGCPTLSPGLVVLVTLIRPFQMCKNSSVKEQRYKRCSYTDEDEI